MRREEVMGEVDNLYWTAAGQALDLYGDETETILAQTIVALAERGDRGGVEIWSRIRATVTEGRAGTHLRADLSPMSSAQH
jgi:hypothetical protein